MTSSPMPPRSSVFPSLCPHLQHGFPPQTGSFLIVSNFFAHLQREKVLALFQGRKNFLRCYQRKTQVSMDRMESSVTDKGERIIFQLVSVALDLGQFLTQLAAVWSEGLVHVAGGGVQPQCAPNICLKAMGPEFLNSSS